MTPNPRRQPHVPFLNEDARDAHEHGERASTPREEELIGSSGTHSPETDERAEEPHGELPEASSVEGGVE
jgi:hypothetical protein